MKQELKGFLYVVFAASLWGLSGTVAKYLFNNAVSPLVLVEIRLLTSAVILGLLLLVVNKRMLRVQKKDLGYLVGLGLFGVTGVQLTYFVTISQTNVATAVFLQYLSPVLVALYALCVQKEKLGWVKALALVLALGGSYLMVFAHGLRVTTLGLISGLMSAVCAAEYTILSKRGLKIYSPWTLLFYCFAIGALAVTLILPPWKIPVASFNWTSLMFFLYIAIFATIIPFGSYFLGLRYLQPTAAGITATLEPVVAAITAFLILNERLLWSQTLGACLVFASVIIVQLEKKPESTERSVE